MEAVYLFVRFTIRNQKSLQQYAEIPDLVWGETKSVPCITLQKPQAKTRRRVLKKAH